MENNKQIQKVYIPLFLQDVPDEAQYFLDTDACKISPDKKKLYVNPQGYVSKKETYTFSNGFHKESGQIIFDEIVLIPEIAETQPPGWLVIDIEAIDADMLYQKEEPEETSEDKQKLDDAWDEYTPAAAVHSLIVMLLSLHRSDVENIANIAAVKAMTQRTKRIMQQEKDYTKFDKVLVMLDDELYDENNKDDKTTPEPEYITILRKVQKVADDKIKVLLSPKASRITQLPAVNEMPLHELRKRLKEYQTKELQDFLELVDKDESSDYERASIIRDYLQQK